MYRNGELVDRDFPVADVARHLEDPSSVVWFDLCAPSQDEMGLLRDELGLHELAITLGIFGLSYFLYVMFKRRDWL
ncbi:hypothetical protein GCM10022267_10790 [Lentzea roselyniae]|uniref:Magnesium transporter n=1 Tax=Lentzea roselyniae TaxID=531940 RepID=A0ABP7A789_9PSEU